MPRSKRDSRVMHCFFNELFAPILTEYYQMKKWSVLMLCKSKVNIISNVIDEICGEIVPL